MDFAEQKTFPEPAKTALGEGGFSKAALAREFAIRDKWKRALVVLAGAAGMKSFSVPVMAGVAGGHGKWSDAAETCRQERSCNY